MTPRVRRSAEETLKTFWLALNKYTTTQGWLVAREMDGRSNRGFVLQRGGQELHFFAKVSQSDRPFWGLNPQKAQEMIIGGKEALILLESPYAGYFLRPQRLASLIHEFSRATGQVDYKINVGKLAREQHFNTIIKLWELLQP